ncbi:Flp pilus assembly protein CpaB [Pararhizobium sp. IMCC21322]|uniref:Flp pilus assembly protein CpaB n=1 Tax=Pararhizobium sp. IMCC21322 TaxID=3067903 RepID=UPI0027411806|nr:Flp pilus assembly protein CpaB [Pararhizobium sp. IMCC21322]
MNRSSLLSLLIAFVLAIAAVVGVQTYLRSQQAALLADNTTKSIPQNTIVVAAQPLRFGKIIEPGSLRVIDWPSDIVPKGAYRTVAEVIGETGEPRYVMSAVETGEPLLTSKITGPGQRATLSAALSPGMKAVSIRVNDVFGVAGFVLPGDRVDVMLTRTIENAATAAASVSTDVLLQGVKVLAIDQLADDRADNPAVVKTITFEVSTSEAQKLTLAQSIGTLSLALRNVGSSARETITAVNINDLDGSTSSELTKPEKPKPKTVVRKPTTTTVAVYRDSERTEYNVLSEIK